MNTLNTQEDIFSVEELESRFEMQTTTLTADSLHPDWSCSLTFNS